MYSPRSSLGIAIRKARNDKKMTQEHLAEMIDITPAHLKQLESNRRNPSIEVLYKLVLALDLSVDTLFANTDDSTQELKNRINLCLERCSVHELQVTYAMVEALLKKGDKEEQE